MLLRSIFPAYRGPSVPSPEKPAASLLKPLPRPATSVAYLEEIKKKRLHTALRDQVSLQFDWLAFGVPFLIIAFGLFVGFDVAMIVASAALAETVLLAVKVSADTTRDRAEGRYFDLLRAHGDLLRRIEGQPRKAAEPDTIRRLDGQPVPLRGAVSYAAAWNDLQTDVTRGFKRPQKIYTDGFSETCWASWSRIDHPERFQPYLRSLDLLMRYLAEHYYGTPDEARFAEHLRANVTVDERRFIWLEARLREKHPKDMLFAVLAHRYFFEVLPFTGVEREALEDIPLNEPDWNEKYEQRWDMAYQPAPAYGMP